MNSARRRELPFSYQRILVTHATIYMYVLFCPVLRELQQAFHAFSALLCPAHGSPVCGHRMPTLLMLTSPSKAALANAAKTHVQIQIRSFGQTCLTLNPKTSPASLHAQSTPTRPVPRLNPNAVNIRLKPGFSCVGVILTLQQPMSHRISAYWYNLLKTSLITD